MGATAYAGIPGPIPFQAHVVAHAAATATEVHPIFRAPFACKLMKVDVVAQAAVTGDNTNRTNLNILNAGAAGSGTTEVGNLDLVTTTGNMIANDSRNVPMNVTYLTAGVTLAEGDVIVLQHEKVGNGVAVPIFLVYLEAWAI
jgi:hypothetical protein